MVTAVLRLFRSHPDTVDVGVLRFKWAELQAEPPLVASISLTIQLK
jgi:hypothetical protein